MSIALNAKATEALKRLRTSDDFRDLFDNLGEIVRDKMNSALGAPVEHRVDQTAYARGLRDLWIAIEAATTNQQQRLVLKPGVK